MSDTWYPGAVRRLGPAVKIQSRTNPASGIVLHSAVGYRAGLYSVLDNTAPPRATVAWHFSVYQNGTVEQHYPIEAVLHHAGNGWANANLIGAEHEGGFNPANEPLTAAQRAASVNLVKWLAAQRGWVPSRTVNKTLFEHNEVSDVATQCPSGRIPWSHYVVAPVQPPPPPLPLSPALNPDNERVWYGLYDAVAGGTEGTHRQLPQTRPGWGRYEFEIKL